MIEFFAQNLATIIGSLIVLTVISLVIFKNVRDSRNNKCTCGSACSGCPTSELCHAKYDADKQ